jgi:hypothetical protein
LTRPGLSVLALSTALLFRLFLLLVLETSGTITLRIVLTLLTALPLALVALLAAISLISLISLLTLISLILIPLVVSHHSSPAS